MLRLRNVYNIATRLSYNGHLSGVSHVLPKHHVSVIPDNSGSGASGTPLRGKKFKVKYNYIPVNVDELELNVGDVVELLSEIEEGWWEGKLKNKIGVFPSNFVTEITEPEMSTEMESHTTIPLHNQISQDANKMEVDEPKTPPKVGTTNDAPVLPPKPKPVKEMCIALFPYEAKHEDELTLKENDMIILLSTDLPDKGWWKGQLNGKIGVFPDNFVKLIALGEEVSKPKRPAVTKATTNKVRDNISKPSTNSNVAALRKSLETPVKADDTNASKKPLVSKKPGFSPSNSSETMKMLFSSPSQSDVTTSPVPERSLNLSANSVSSEASSAVKNESDGKPWTETSADSCKPKSVSGYEKLNVEVQSIKESDSTDGIGGSKVYKMNNGHDSRAIGSANSKENTSERELDLNVIERSELLTHPTASRAKAPKRRPPSGINFKEEEIMPTATAKVYNSKVTVNGTPDLASDKQKAAAPWLQELKLSQEKKNTSQVNLRGGFTSTGSNVTFRFQRPVSMFSGDADSQLSFQPKSLPPSTEQTATAVSSTAIVSTEKVVTVSANEWNALNEKVNALEMRVEMQNECFVKTMEQLKLQLAREIELRIEMKNEMDKLMELVTQV